MEDNKMVLQQAVADDADFNHLLEQLRTVALRASVRTEMLFKTDAPKLWEKYISNMPAEEAKVLNCSACRSFINRYGSLATIDNEGKLASVLWPEELEAGRYEAAVVAMRNAVENATVTGLFLAETNLLGAGERNGWKHFRAEFSDKVLNSSQIETVNAERAKRQQALKTFKRWALGAGFSVTESYIRSADRAVHLFRTGVLFQAERFQAHAEWVVEVLKMAMATRNNKIKHNLLWKYVAQAPLGWMSPNTAVNQLIRALPQKNEQLAVGTFNKSTKVTNYMQATTPASEGSKAVAEKVFEDLGIGSALGRRTASFEEIPKEVMIWLPKVEAPVEKKSLFGDLPSKDETKKQDLPVVVSGSMSWARFTRTMLDTADKIQVQIGNAIPGHQVTTSLDPESKPIFMWDYPEDRNRFSWVTTQRSTPPSAWGTSHLKMVEILGISHFPSTWSQSDNEKMKDLGFGQRSLHNMPEGVFLFMKGLSYKHVEAVPGLFPPIIRRDLHGVRSVISSYNENNRLDLSEERLGGGAWAFTTANNGLPVHLYVTSGDHVTAVTIDRWE